jgi:hypothetical protein
MLSTKVRLYKNLFHKSFFFDKFLTKNVFQCPKITSLQLKLFSSLQLGLNSLKLSKLILLFYLLTGQCPQLLLKQCNLRNTQRNKVLGLQLTLQNYASFFNFLTHRQLSLLTPSYQVQQLIQQSTVTLNITHKVYDDDILYQAIKLTDLIKYQIIISSNALTKSHFCTLLTNFKIPCTINKLN